jgi:hypothetical protein
MRGVGPKFSERDNHKVIAVLWTMMTQPTPVTPQQLQADAELHLTKKKTVPAYEENQGGWSLEGDGPMTSVFLAADGHRIHVWLDPDRVCVAPSSVAVQTGANPRDRLDFATDGGPASSSPEFEYPGTGFTSHMQLSRGCSEHIEIVRYRDETPPRPH